MTKIRNVKVFSPTGQEIGYASVTDDETVDIKIVLDYSSPVLRTIIDHLRANLAEGITLGLQSTGAIPISFT